MNWLLVSQIAIWIILLGLLAFLYFFVKMIYEFLYRFRLTNSEIREISLMVGQNAPLFRGKDQHGELIRLSENNNRMTILAFVSNSCPACHRMINHLPEVLENFDVRTIILSQEKVEDNLIKKFQSAHFIISPESFTNYFIKEWPTIFLIKQDNNILGILNDRNMSTLSEILKHHTKLTEKFEKVGI